MKIEIDWDLCQGHGNCTGDAPDVFRLTEDGKLEVLQWEPPKEQWSNVDSAVRYCPTQAIRFG